MAAGPRGLLAFWMGGACAPAPAAGVRSMLAPWIGGAGAATTPQAGVRALLAFWAGGAAAGQEVVPPTPSAGGGGGHRLALPRALIELQRLRLIDDDELLMAMLAALPPGMRH